MNAISAAYFVIGLGIGILAGWFILLLLCCLLTPVLSSKISREDENQPDDGMEWVLGKDQHYKRVKKP